MRTASRTQASAFERLRDLQHLPERLAGQPVWLAGGVHHLDWLELDLLEVEPAEARRLLVEAAAAESRQSGSGEPWWTVS